MFYITIGFDIVLLCMVCFSFDFCVVRVLLLRRINK